MTHLRSRLLPAAALKTVSAFKTRKFSQFAAWLHRVPMKKPLGKSRWFRWDAISRTHGFFMYIYYGPQVFFQQYKNVVQEKGRQNAHGEEKGIAKGYRRLLEERENPNKSRNWARLAVVSMCASGWLFVSSPSRLAGRLCRTRSGPRSSALPLISELDSYSRWLPRYRSLKRSLSVGTHVFLSFKS